jgi:hypothetical protein
MLQASAKASRVSRACRNIELMRFLHKAIEFAILGSDGTFGEALMALLKPCPDEWIKVWPVDNRVGNVRNKEASLVQPVEPLTA